MIYSWQWQGKAQEMTWSSLVGGNQTFDIAESVIKIALNLLF